MVKANRYMYICGYIFIYVCVHTCVAWDMSSWGELISMVESADFFFCMVESADDEVDASSRDDGWMMQHIPSW